MLRTDGIGEVCGIPGLSPDGSTPTKELLCMNMRDVLQIDGSAHADQALDAIPRALGSIDSMSVRSTLDSATRLSAKPLRQERKKHPKVSPRKTNPRKSQHDTASTKARKRELPNRVVGGTREEETCATSTIRVCIGVVPPRGANFPLAFRCPSLGPEKAKITTVLSNAPPNLLLALRDPPGTTLY